MRWFQLKSFPGFLWRSHNQHGIHSPFVYALITQCLYNRTSYRAYREIRSYQKKIKTFTASGSVNTSSLSFKTCKLLYRLSHYFNPASVLDLSGTLGLGGFASCCDQSSSLHVTAASPKQASLTRRFLREQKLTKAQILNTAFENEHERWGGNTFDFIIWRPMTSAESPWAIFKFLLPYVSTDSLFIFEGPHRSSTWADEWEKIKAHEAVTVTVDLFFWGLVFFKEGQAKQHFKIRI